MNPESTSLVSRERVERAIQLRYSPFPELSMELLSAQLNRFRVGELRPAARTWEIMLERDGELAGPVQKRCADVGRLPWDIARAEDSAEADRHAEALRYFYTHLTATHALEQDQAGGINLLIQQLATAHAHRYSVHEQVWQVDDAGRKQVTGIFRHCPVWFFEARHGRLAFLKSEGDWDGVPLARGEWLRGVGHGHMRPCSIAYVVKHAPLRDWLLFSSRFGLPGVHGETTAAKGSREWDDFVEALGAFANDWVTATNAGTKINLIESAKGSANLPFKDLVERSDRLYARLFRGGDLSTQSREGHSTGALLQDEEKTVLLEDDAQWASGICNTDIDEPLIEFLFGARPKAWFVLRVPKQPDSTREINAMTFLTGHGGKVSLREAHARLQIPMAAQEEALLGAAGASPAAPKEEKPGQSDGSDSPNPSSQRA